MVDRLSKVHVYHYMFQSNFCLADMCHVTLAGDDDGKLKRPPNQSICIKKYIFQTLIKKAELFCLNITNLRSSTLATLFCSIPFSLRSFLISSLSTRISSSLWLYWISPLFRVDCWIFIFSYRRANSSFLLTS